jgi:predicted nuclease of predicted toxin-antitoxin system
MKLLLDESLPKKLKRSLGEHEVSTVTEMGWRGIKNGKLLALAAGSFDAFLTADQNLGYQQNLKQLALSVIVLEAYSNRLVDYLPLIDNLKFALQQLPEKSYTTVRASAS